MKVKVLRSAIEDLAAGRKFYDSQEAGVGDYFFDSLLASYRNHVTASVMSWLFELPKSNLTLRYPQ
jgi:hypothetical protein